MYVCINTYVQRVPVYPTHTGFPYYEHLVCEWYIYYNR